MYQNGDFEIDEELQDVIDEVLSENGIDRYAVVYMDEPDVVYSVPDVGLSNILQCDHCPSDYDILFMERCGG